jgi:hypothetical protein
LTISLERSFDSMPSDGVPTGRAPEPAFTRVNSAAMSREAIVRSAPAEALVVRTDPQARVVRTSDDELLDSLGERPAVLVRQPGQSARLVLAQLNRPSPRP